MSDRISDDDDRIPDQGPEHPETLNEDPSYHGFRRRLRNLQQRLESPPSDGERAPLREELVALVRDVDASIESLRALRESMKPLADRYREKYLRPAPEVAKVVDHLGASTFRERGWSALAASDYEEAARHLQAALDRDPKELSAMAMLAWSYLRLDRPGDADDLLRQALAIDSLHPLARTIAGFAHLLAGRLEPAMELLRTVSEDDSSTDRTARMYAHLYLGVALARAGRPTEGQASIGRAIELGPNLTEAFWELGRLHANEGEPDSAIDAWRAGAENRFSGWGTRCRAELERAEDAAARGLTDAETGPDGAEGAAGEDRSP